MGEGQLCERAWEVSHGSARGGGPRCGGQRACATAARQTLVRVRRPPGAPTGPPLPMGVCPRDGRAPLSWAAPCTHVACVLTRHAVSETYPCRGESPVRLLIVSLF